MNKIVRFAAYINILVGLMVILGWVLDIQVLKCLTTDSAPMKFNSAILFVLLGLTFWGISAGWGHPYVQNTIIVIILCISIAVMLQFLFNIDFNIDELFLADNHVKVYPGRMSPASTLCFVILGIGLLLAKSKSMRSRSIAQNGFQIVALIGFLAFVGHLYKVPVFYQVSNMSMAVHASILFVISAIAATFINPSMGITGVFTGKGTGNAMARILFPTYALVLVLFGLIRVEMHRLGFVNVEFATVVMVVLFMLVMLSMIAITAGQLNKIDAKRMRVEESYLALNKSLESKVEERTVQFKEIKERFEMATHAAEIGIWEVSLQDKLCVGNEYFYKLLDVNRHDAITLDGLVSKIHPDDRPQEIGNMDMEGINQGSGSIFRIMANDHTIRHIKVMWTSKVNTEGKRERVYGACIDVTTQVRFEEELQSQYSKVKSFLKDAPASIAMVDNDLAIIAVSEQWFKEYPVQVQGEAIGQQFPNLFPKLYECLKSDFEVCLNGETVKREGEKLQRENGDWCWAKYVLTPWYNDEGVREGVIIKMLDITLQRIQEIQLREAQERLTLAVEVSGVGIYEWDLINNLIYVDEVMSRLYGSERMTPEEAPKIIASSMHPGDYDETVRYMEDVFKDPTYLKLDIVYRIIWPDSSIHYIKSKGTIMRDETGRPFRLVGTNMDITLQKNAEEQLTKGYNTIRTFVESAPSAIAMFDTDLRYLAVSYQWIKDYRLNHYNLVGMLHYDVFPEVPQFWKEIHQACLKGETRESQGEQFLRADGSVQWIKYVVCPWYDAAGDIGGIIMNTSDITEQRAAVEELIKTKERLQLATEASKVGVWDWDIKNDLLYWDDQMYKLYGVDKAKEEDPEKILDAHVHPDDKQRVRAELKMALQGLMDVDTEFRVLWSNGMQRHIKAKAVVQRDAQDRAIRMVGTNLDITQLKVQLETLRQSEERYFKMVNEVQDYAIVLLDNRGKIENWNYGAEKIFEYTAVEIVGSSIEVFFTPEDINAQKVEQLFLASLETGRAQDEGWRVKKSGHLFLGNTTITALHGMQDEIIGFSMVIHDLTERKKAELTEKMEAKNKELEQITYIASHDLQEPLRTITGIVNIMNQQYVEQLDEDADKYLKFMKDASERMRNLIKGLLDYSRMGKGNEAIYFDSKEVLHEITQDLAVYIHESKAKITIVGNLPYIKAFKTEFRLLLQNLISNAIKFRNKGIDPEITIYANKENNSWKFGVKDNGIGIEPKYQEKIFMIFQRLHNRTEYEGTGIGLSHCKKIVELHGGRIWVDSYPGEGSTFYFTIPI